VNVYSKRELSGILRASGFDVKSIVARKCTSDDIPAPRPLNGLFRAVPQPIYSALGRVAGWYLVVNAS